MKQLMAMACLLMAAACAAQTSGMEKWTAFKKQQRMLATSPYRQLQWRLAGPDTHSGRCTDVEGIPGDTSTFYAAFATGGLWKTEDGGQNWKPLFDKEITQSIGDIALAPSATNILYVGTGEANILRASLPGAGMFRSDDGGATFRHIGLQSTGTIARIIVDPKNPDHVYVAAGGNEWTYNDGRGVYETKDGGKTWRKILYVDVKTGCSDLVMDPYNPAILYASMWNRIRRRWSDPVPESGDYLYKTTDGGRTWKQLHAGLPDTKLTGRVGLAVAPSNPDILYALVDDHHKKRDPKPGETDSYERQVKKVVIGTAIYRSRDKGESWEKMGEVHDFVKPFSGTYGWVFGQLRVHPHNENRVYALGVEKAVSHDGGKTWKKWEPSDTTSEWTHGDHHALWIDPTNPRRIIMGNDGGVSITHNGGARWKNFFSKIPTTQCYTLAYDMQSPFNIFTAIQDQGTFSGSSMNTFGRPQQKNLRAWGDAPGGEGTRIQVDPKDHNIVYSSSFYGRLMKSDLSRPDSLRSKKIPLFAVGAIDSLRAEWLAATLLSKHDNKRIYHGLQHVYMSEDAGANWQRISDDLSSNDTNRMGRYPYLIYHQAITVIAEGRNNGELWAGTDDGRLWYRRPAPPGQPLWEKMFSPMPGDKQVAAIVPSTHRPGRVFVVLNDRRQDNQAAYIFYTDDNGQHWTPAMGNLPASPVNVLAEDPEKKDVWYCGTDMGVYMSRNNGVAWQCLNGNLPAAVSVNDLFIHPRDKKLVIATYGRGVYVLDDMNFK